jgi:hypothetical protein
MKQKQIQNHQHGLVVDGRGKILAGIYNTTDILQAVFGNDDREAVK